MPFPLGAQVQILLVSFFSHLRPFFCHSSRLAVSTQVGAYFLASNDGKVEGMKKASHTRMVASMHKGRETVMRINLRTEKGKPEKGLKNAFLSRHSETLGTAAGGNSGRPTRRRRGRASGRAVLFCVGCCIRLALDSADRRSDGARSEERGAQLLDRAIPAAKLLSNPIRIRGSPT